MSSVEFSCGHKQATACVGSRSKKILVVTQFELNLLINSKNPRNRSNWFGPNSTLDGHVVIGVVLGFTTQTQYQVQSSFLLNFVVQLCTCSQTVFCDRQFHL